MIGQKLLNTLNATITDLERVTETLSLSDLVDIGARLRASVAALKGVSEGVDDRVKPQASVDTPLGGVNFCACLTLSIRSGLDIKGLRAGVAEKIWKPYVTETPVYSLTYKPR